MARNIRDPLMEDVKRIRRKISARLWKAMQEGRVLQELRAMDRRGRRAQREALANRNGKPRT